MGRAGVTYSEVVQAAENLVGQGQNPTVDTIRALLGTGSKSTIAPLLKQWRSQKEGGFNGAGALPGELVALIKGLYEKLQQQAQLTVEKAQFQFEDERRSLQSTVQQSRTELQQVHAALKDLQMQLSQAQSDHLSKAKALEKAELDKATASEKIVSLQTQNEQLSQQLVDTRHQCTLVQRNLEHFRDASQQQMLSLKSDAEKREAGLQQDKQQLQLQVERGRDSEKRLLDKIVSLENQWEAHQIENEKVAKQSAQTERALQNADKELVKKNSLLKQLQASCDALQQDHKLLSSKHDKAKVLVDELKLSHIQLAKDLDIERQLRSRTEDQLSQLQNKNDEILFQNGQYKEKIGQLLAIKK